MGWKGVSSFAESFFTQKGLDLIQPFKVQWYNKRVDYRYHLPDWQRENTLGILIGNSKSLWPCLMEYYSQQEPHLVERELNPVDRYCEKVVLEFSSKMADHQHEIRWVTDGGSRLVAMQQLAHISGLAYLCKKSMLNIHHILGPWISFRAVIVVNMDGPSHVQFKEGCKLRCLSDIPELGEFELAHPLPFSEVLMEVALQEALSSTSASWRKWLAVRDAFPIDKKYRFSNEMIEHHYSSDRSVFLNSVEQLRRDCGRKL